MVRVLLVTAASLLLAAAGDRCAADIRFTGTVDPGSPGEVDALTEVTVGPPLFDQTPGDPRGSIFVDGGSLFEAGRLLVGNGDSALARMEVTGDQTRVQVNGNGEPALSVGARGSGYLKIDGGAWVNVGSQGQGTMTIGSTEGDSPIAPVGVVEVRGESSLLTVGRELTVGEGVSSSLSIQDGAVVRVGANFNPGVTIAGTVEVSGGRSELQANWLSLGFENQGGMIGNPELRVSNEAVVRPFGYDTGRATINAGARVLLDGGVFALPVENMRGTLEGSGSVTQSLDLSPSGEVRVKEGDKLVVDAGIDSTGSISVTDGELEVYGALHNENVGEAVGSVEFTRSDVSLFGGLDNRGRMNLFDSQLVVGPGINEGTNQVATLGGDLEATNSRLELTIRAQTFGVLTLVNSELVIDAAVGGSLSQLQSGRDPSRIILENSEIRQEGCCGVGFSNSGVIEARTGENRVLTSVQGSDQSVLEIGPDASVEFGYALFDGGIKVAAGGTAMFTWQARSGDMTITLTEQNLQRPSLVAKSRTLNNPQAEFRIDGELTVATEGLEALELGQTLWLIGADRLEGWFDDYTLPELPGTLDLLPVQTETTLSLRVIDTATELPGDFNMDGRVDAADYTLWRDGLSGGQFELDRLVWRKNFGRALASGSASVPEPTSLAPAMIALLAGLRLRRAAEVG